MEKITTQLLILIILIFTSCSKDDDSTPEPTPEVEIPEILPTATETCLYSDLVIEENSTVTIDCLLDLEGQTIGVPAGVTFEFGGGDISNGILNFTSRGKIAGEFLNSELTVEGDIQLTNKNFNFYPERWKIVEVDAPSNPQPATLNIAYENHQILQGTIDLVHTMGANTFAIDKLNAFFDSLNGETDYLAKLTSVILLPSDFNLIMTDNTYLRIFPASGDTVTKMIRISQSENITITGGNLIGDRLTHYVEAGGKNITVDGVNMSLANSAGLTIFSYSNIKSVDYFGSQYVTVKNCIFDSNRTNNLALTDGQDITFENNFLYRAGNDLDADFGTSEGLAPRIGIILETQINQYIENVIIKGNIVEDTKSIEQHSILAVGATNIEITGNTTDKNVGWSTALGVEVKG